MNLTSELMLRAFEHLDKHLQQPVRLVMGGGGAMLLAHHFRLSTSDVDAVPTSGISMDALAAAVEKVSIELCIPIDWLNPHYASFTHVLPSDYGSRLIDVCTHAHLRVSALSKTDLLIMKCFAGRQKDVVHARVLFRDGADATFVRNHLKHLETKRIPGTEKALRFLGEIEAFFEDQE